MCMRMEKEPIQIGEERKHENVVVNVYDDDDYIDGKRKKRSLILTFKCHHIQYMSSHSMNRRLCPEFSI